MLNFKHWLTQGIITWIITLALGGAGSTMLTLLALHHSVWATPLLYGVATFFMVVTGGCVVMATTRLPRVRSRTTVRNVESRARGWLDHSRVSVKNDPTPETFFRWAIQLSGGSHLMVGRSRIDFTEHIIIRANIVNASNMPDELKRASQEDNSRLVELIKPELARARIGYSGLQIPVTAQDFDIFKSIPINDHLDEDSFMRAVFDIEAAINAISAIFGLWKQRSNAISSG